MAKDIFDEPFDDGTRIKLEIYRQYLKEWLPVFVVKKPPTWTTVQIFDFFAGEGKDIEGTAGSPAIALEVIQSLQSPIVINKIKVILHLNELDKNKFEKLQKNIGPPNSIFEVRLYNMDFNNLFNQRYESMMSSANLIFLDQNGIKQVTGDVFAKITALKQTDVLFYISSSFFRRFATTVEFSKYFPFDPGEVSSINYCTIFTGKC